MKDIVKTTLDLGSIAIDTENKKIKDQDALLKFLGTGLDCLNLALEGKLWNPGICTTLPLPENDMFFESSCNLDIVTFTNSDADGNNILVCTAKNQENRVLASVLIHSKLDNSGHNSVSRCAINGSSEADQVPMTLAVAMSFAALLED